MNISTKMREVVIADAVMDKIADLRIYLIEQLKLSWGATQKRIDRIDGFLLSLTNTADYPKCRFKGWRTLGYRCAVFEKNWVFAYEVFEDGIIVRDMSHTSLLAK
jgi:hypothetical protein